VERRRSLIALCALVTATRIWAGPSEDGVKANDEEKAPPAAAATKVVAYQGGRFLLRRAPYGECVVALQGAVTRDAAPRFDDIVKEADALLCNKPLLLLLESPGGLVLDAIGLGERVRAQGLRTVVRYGCASACSLIFLGGVERVLWGSRAAIGLHQPRDYDCDRFGTSLGTHRIKDYLREVVPLKADQILELIMATSCQSISWIRGERAIELGIATELKAPGIDVFGSEASRRVTK